MTDSKSKRLLTGAAAVAGGALSAAGVIGWRRWRSRDHAGAAALPPGQALITGASAGIGEAFARQLAAAGYDLTLVARRADRLEALAAELSAAHAIRAEALAADLSGEEDVARVVRHIEGLDDLTLLINNAGFGTRGTFAEVELERSLDMIRVHLIASVALARAALPGMIARGAGAIINVSSVAAFFASVGGANYGATKAYLNVFSETLAAELRGTGVKVQALCPGFTATEFHEVGDYQGFDRAEIPGAVWMSADEVAAESLAALRGDRVIVVPGAKYRAMVAASRSPLGGPIRRAARAVRRRWRKG